MLSPNVYNISYSPCLQITINAPVFALNEGFHVNVGKIEMPMGKKFTSNVCLPKNETVVQVYPKYTNSGEWNSIVEEYHCEVLTNYGRKISTKPITRRILRKNSVYWTYYDFQNTTEIVRAYAGAGQGFDNDTTEPIIHLDALPNELDVFCIRAIHAQTTDDFQSIIKDITEIQNNAVNTYAELANEHEAINTKYTKLQDTLNTYSGGLTKWFGVF